MRLAQAKAGTSLARATESSLSREAVATCAARAVSAALDDPPTRGAIARVATIRLASAGGTYSRPISGSHTASVLGGIERSEEGSARTGVFGICKEVGHIGTTVTVGRFRVQVGEREELPVSLSRRDIRESRWLAVSRAGKGPSRPLGWRSWGRARRADF